MPLPLSTFPLISLVVDNVPHYTHHPGPHVRATLQRSGRLCNAEKKNTWSNIQVCDNPETIVSHEWHATILFTMQDVTPDFRTAGDLGLLPSGKPTIQDAKELFDFADGLYRIVKELLEKSTEEDPGNNKSNEGKD